MCLMIMITALFTMLVPNDQVLYYFSPQRLKNWESRERKKSREYEKENDREDERRAEEVRFCAGLLIFFF